MQRIYSVFYLTTFTAVLFLFFVNAHNSLISLEEHQLHKIKVKNKAVVVVSVGFVGLAVVELNNYFYGQDEKLSLVGAVGK